MSETATPASSQPRVGIAELKRFVSQALTSAGIPAEDATHVAALMAESAACGGGGAGGVRAAAVREADPRRGGQCKTQHSDSKRQSGCGTHRRRQRPRASGYEAS